MNIMFIRVLHLIGFFLPFSTGFTSHHIRPSFAKLKTFSKGAVKELITEPAQEECLLTAAPVSVVKLTWEPETADDIRDVINDRIQRRGENERHQPYMVAVVGIPGSGKSTSSSILTGSLTDVGCVLMPFDGYHYPMSALEQFSNAEDVIYRRGAPDTFDVELLKRDLHSIRYGDVKTISVPGFDHAAGDPEPDAHMFQREKHNAVVVEGLYLLHDEDGWEEVANFFDLTIFVDANVDICVDRLKERNKCIPGYTPEEIEVRCDVVDRKNAETVDNSKHKADLVVQSAATLQ